jgi:EAL domain-containing protein (putative c-di-GMP-specific phosphodiesterase class I)
LIQENKLVKNQLDALKSLGVSLSIDDFGTGYSNMNYLTRLKVDTLKLDRSFISQISTSEDYLVIVTAIIRMAQVLGMEVVAEGIEKEAERKLLIDLDCDYAQGYLWSKAVPNKDFVVLLSGFSDSPEKKSLFA